MEKCQAYNGDVKKNDDNDTLALVIAINSTTFCLTRDKDLFLRDPPYCHRL